MATSKVIVEGSSVTASQMKDFWRQTSEGTIDGAYLQAVLAASRKRREMFMEGREFEGDKSQPEIGTLNAIVDLDVEPKLPYYGGATVKEHARGGKVTIERRTDGLYIDGYKVVLCLSERQVGGAFQVHELRRELDGKPISGAGALDFLVANQNFVPDEMKKDATGKAIFTFFWGTVYCHSFWNLCVRYCFWRDDGEKGLIQGLVDGHWEFMNPDMASLDHKLEL